jgi:hypothetical protein
MIKIIILVSLCESIAKKEPLPGPPLKGREQNTDLWFFCSLPFRGGPGRGS